MIKCFLSHSSKDKASYVRPVAEKLKTEVKVFDEETFEKGMSPAEEIIAGLGETSLFVIFLSEHALESDWVKNELSRAKFLLDQDKIDRIYPIIIDEGLDYTDSRIPQWMRDNLNIQPILTPGIAARKINARLTEISWNYHPRLKEKKEIFVGRNALVNTIEERLDDFSLPTPSAIFASGLTSIGRKSLLQYALRKASCVRESFEFPVISLSPYDGIEDFILKLSDLGLSKSERIHERLSGSYAEKIELAQELVHKLFLEKERVLIEDRGALVGTEGKVVDWFSNAIEPAKEEGYLSFIVASRYRLNASTNRVSPEFFAVSVGELDVNERKGLLVRYSKFEELNLSKEDLSFFSDLLSGYPEQVLYAVNLVRDNGVHKAKRLSHTIQQYASDKAKVVLDGLKNEQQVLNLIHLLSKFEFISYEVLFEIVDEQTYFPVLEKLLASSVCERMGTSADYVRVNEAIRDYVSRNRFGIPTIFDAAVKAHVNSFIQRYSDENPDISDYLFSAQEALRTGGDIPQDLIIPSVFIKTIKKLYDEDRNYQEANSLADRILQREKSLHSNTINHIRFIKCQCLARLRSADFFNEVRKVPEPDRSFLYGFYYRLSGDYTKAEENLNRIISKGRRDPRTLGELVLVYMQSDEYDLAFSLAKENYRARKNNPINANNYFSCLIIRERTPENKEELEQIISSLELDTSDRAQEMLYSAKARMAAFYDNDEKRSMAIIEDAIDRFPSVDYPTLTKADLATFFKNEKALKEAVGKLEKNVSRNAQTFRPYIRYKATLLAMSGELHQAKLLVSKELKGLIGSSQQKLIERLESLASERGK